MHFGSRFRKLKLKFRKVKTALKINPTQKGWGWGELLKCYLSQESVVKTKIYTSCLQSFFLCVAPPLTFSPLLSSNLFLPLHLAVLVLCEMLGCGFLSDLKLHFNSLICEILDFADSSLSVYIWVPFIQVSQCDQCFTV